MKRTSILSRFRKTKISKAEVPDSAVAGEKYKSTCNTTGNAVLQARNNLLIHFLHELTVHVKAHNNMLPHAGFFSVACAFNQREEKQPLWIIITRQ